MTRPAARLVAAVLGAAAVVVLSAAPAAAHAELVSTDPPAGARLAEAPPSATVTFSEQVDAPAGSVRLHDARGEVVTKGPIQRVDGGRTLRLALGDLPDGGYVLSWRVLSADGHPVSGGVTWRIGLGGEDVDAGDVERVVAGEDGDDAVGTAIAIARTLLFAGLVLLIGGWAFAALRGASGIATTARGRLLLGGWAAAVVGTVAGIGLQGADVAGRGLRDAARPSVVSDVLGTDLGTAAIARLGLLALTMVVLVLGRRYTRQPAPARWPLVEKVAQVTLAVGLATTIALAGHARTGRWTGLAAPLDVVHVLAGSVWLGGLVALLVCLWDPAGAGEDTVDTPNPVMAVARRYSDVALAAVAAVVTTGVVQGIRQTGGLEGLRDTSYGRLLTAKVIGIVALLLLGFLSRTALRARDDGTLYRLRQSVAGEAAMAVVILAVTSLLVAANPDRVGPETGFVQAKVVEGTVFEVVVSPARTGPVDIHVYIQDPSSGLTGAQEATAVLSLPSRDIPGITVPLLPAGRNHFSGNDVDVPIKGAWTLEVQVRIGDLTQRTATFTVPIR